MKERDLRNLLLEQPIVGEHTAEERTWDVVRQAFLARERVPRERRVPWRLLVALAIVGAGVGVGVTSGSAIADWVRDKLGRETIVGAEEPEPVLLRLPVAGSRLLVTAPNGVWVVNDGGGQRFLGDYDGATWSPNGLFVAAWNDTELVALDPTRTDGLHWTQSGVGIAGARWAPSGFRVAYLAGTSLHVIVGNGTDDKVLAPAVAPVLPAWRPGQEHVLAYADPEGRVLVVDTDSGRVLWRTARASLPIALTWLNREELAVLTEQRIRIFRAPRQLVAAIVFPRDLYTATSIAASPDGRRIAYAVYSKRDVQGIVYVYDGRVSRQLFSGGGRFRELAWSPDGRFLLVPWRAADQWLFIRTFGGPRVRTSADIARQFAPGEEAGAAAPGYPSVEGWCCPTEEPLPPPPLTETGATETGTTETGFAETGVAETGVQTSG
jgi:hypothetical protein